MRTMTVHAMSPAERAELDTLVTTMVSYGARRSRLRVILEGLLC